MQSRIHRLSILILVIFFQVSHAYPTYEDYLHDFNKSYSSQEEITQRKHIYDSRIAHFAQITDYTPGVNNFTDWTDEQIWKIKNFKAYEPENFSSSIEQADDTSYLRVSASQQAESLDWRTQRAVTSVKQQGSACGSCWAFAVAAYVESKLIIQKNYPTNVDLSEQYLLSCTPKSDCDGGYVTQALQIVAKRGIPYESSFPYNPEEVDSKICSTQNTVREAGSRYRRKDYLTDNQLIDLLQYGPVVIPVSSQNWIYYQGGVFTCPITATLDHAVLLVGYTNTTWIIKNQWGKLWGESGYMRITRSRSKNYTNCFIGYFAVYLDPIIFELQSYGSPQQSAFVFLFILLASLFF